MYKIYLILPLFYSHLFPTVFIDDLKDAKVGECYKKVTIPAKYETKDELIEVEKASTKISIKNPIFKTSETLIEIVPSYIDIKDTMAKFQKSKIKLPINEKKSYFTIGKSHDIPLKNEFVIYLKKQGVKLEELKTGQCLIEYATIPPKKTIKKEFEKKQAFEIIDVAPPKFKTIKKKIKIKPAYTKIIKTPAIYETKVEKILISPAQKVYNKKNNGLVCVQEKPAVYKNITKKILITPPKTKVIKFPPTFKEIEVKVLQTPPSISRRVVPPKKESYDFYLDNSKDIKYFWLKEGSKTSAKQTGLKICKKSTEVKYISRDIQKVIKPATTKKITVPPKVKTIKIKELVSDSNITNIQIPVQYEKINAKVQISPAKIVWKKVECTKADSKEKAVR